MASAVPQKGLIGENPGSLRSFPRFRGRTQLNLDLSASHAPSKNRRRVLRRALEHCLRAGMFHVKQRTLPLSTPWVYVAG